MIATIVLSVLLAVAVIIAIIVIVKDRKKGKCCGGCSSCEGCPYNRQNCQRKNLNTKSDLKADETECSGLSKADKEGDDIKQKITRKKRIELKNSQKRFKTIAVRQTKMRY